MGKWCQNDVVSTSRQRYQVVNKTSFYVKCPLVEHLKKGDGHVSARNGPPNTYIYISIQTNPIYKVENVCHDHVLIMVNFCISLYIKRVIS